jgi:hypothetical protein
MKKLAFFIAAAALLGWAAGGFLIIAQNAVAFLADHPGYDGTVIDSVVSLVNTGDTIRMIDAGNQVQASPNLLKKQEDYKPLFYTLY